MNFLDYALDVHGHPDQIKRQNSSKEIKIPKTDINQVEQLAVIRNYEVTLKGCRCIDYSTRKLPCKHIYALATALGLFATEQESRIENVDSDFSNWIFPVPEAFASLLDVVPTPRTKNLVTSLVLTRGKWYNFPAGVIIYDTSMAYALPWADALKHIKLCLQIRESTSPESTYTFSLNDNKLIRKQDVKQGYSLIDVYRSKQANLVRIKSRLKLANDELVNFMQYGKCLDYAGSTIEYNQFL